MKKSDVQLVEKAITKRWNIDERAKDAIAKKIVRQAITTHDGRFLLRAGEFILKAESQNQRDQHHNDEQDLGPAQTNVVVFLPDNGRGDVVT
jgi:hypothetical protein